MKIFPIVTAALVTLALYFVILDREALVNFAGRFGAGGDDVSATDQGLAAQTATADATPVAEDDRRVHVVALRSSAEIRENAVVLRGRTEAVRQVSVSSETSGRIVSDPIRAGAMIDEVQVMCQIDPGTSEVALAEATARLLEAQARLPEARAQLPVARARQAEAEANLVAARLDANAASRLSESGFASETRAANAAATVSAAQAAVESAAASVEAADAGIQSAQSGIQAAQAGVQRAEQDIERLTIRAPFSGILETDTGELGQLLQPGALCATIIQLDPMKLVGFVPEAQVDRVEIGATAGARLASGQEAVGRVTFLSRSADPQTRTFRVEIEIPNADLAIRDGQTAEILVSTQGTPAHLLPSSALTLNDEGILGVRIARDGIARFAPVTMLRDTAQGVWLSGLPQEADVIIVGQEFVTDGVPVRVTYAEEQTQ